MMFTGVNPYCKTMEIDGALLCLWIGEILPRRGARFCIYGPLCNGLVPTATDNRIGLAARIPSCQVLANDKAT